MGLVKNEYNLTPGSLYLGEVKTGGTKSSRINIERKDGREFSIVKVRNQTPEGLQINVPFNNTRQQHIIDIQFIAKMPDLFRHNIVLKCEPGCPSIFTVSALVVP